MATFKKTKTNPKKSTTTKKTTFSSVRSNIQNKINSYRTLCNQTTGGTSKSRPTPAQLNTFAKWVDKGAMIQNVTPTQLNRWAGKPQNWTTISAKQQLFSKYGKSCIKAVTSSKTGGFIVATSAVRGGKSFKIK